MFPPSAAVDFGAWFARFAALQKIPGYSVTPGQLFAPEIMYPAPPEPHAPLTPAPDAWTLPPADGDDAQATIDDVIARTKAAQDLQVLDFFKKSFPGDVGKNAPSILPEISGMWLVAIVAATALGLILILQTTRKLI
jgi:hypothetical protein